MGKTCVAVVTDARAASTRTRGLWLKAGRKRCDARSAGLRNADATGADEREHARAVLRARESVLASSSAIAPHIAAISETHVIGMIDALEHWYRRAAAGFDFAIVEGAGAVETAVASRRLPERFRRTPCRCRSCWSGLRLGVPQSRAAHARGDRAWGRCRFAGWIGNRVDPEFAPLPASTLRRSSGLLRRPRARDRRAHGGARRGNCRARDRRSSALHAAPCDVTSGCALCCSPGMVFPTLVCGG